MGEEGGGGVIHLDIEELVEIHGKTAFGSVCSTE
jgi:hypothetical protein